MLSSALLYWLADRLFHSIVFPLFLCIIMGSSLLPSCDTPLLTVRNVPSCSSTAYFLLFIFLIGPFKTTVINASMWGLRIDCSYILLKGTNNNISGIPNEHWLQEHGLLWFCFKTLVLLSSGSSCSDVLSSHSCVGLRSSMMHLGQLFPMGDNILSTSAAVTLTHPEGGIAHVYLCVRVPHLSLCNTWPSPEALLVKLPHCLKNCAVSVCFSIVWACMHSLVCTDLSQLLMNIHDWDASFKTERV